MKKKKEEEEFWGYLAGNSEITVQVKAQNTKLIKSPFKIVTVTAFAYFFNPCIEN